MENKNRAKEQIEVIIKRPGESPVKKTISNRLDSLQAIVGGCIEMVTLASDLVIICNEEGRIMGLPYNCDICGISFVGPIIFAGVNEDEFADVPEAISNLFNKNINIVTKERDKYEAE